MADCNKRFSAGSQTSVGVQDRDPRRVTVRCAPGWLLVGKTGQSPKVTPVGAGQVATIGAGQLFSDGRGQIRGQRLTRDVEPSLQMAGATLNGYARLESIPAHPFQDDRVGRIQIEQNVAGVPPLRIRMNIDVTALAIPQAKKNGPWQHWSAGLPSTSVRRGKRGA